MSRKLLVELNTDNVPIPLSGQSCTLNIKFHFEKSPKNWHISMIFVDFEGVYAINSIFAKELAAKGIMDVILRYFQFF